jgi:hypothetical protein
VVVVVFFFLVELTCKFFRGLLNLVGVEEEELIVVVLGMVEER